VSIHARQGELKGGDPASRARVEQRPPSWRRIGRTSLVGVERGEEEAGECGVQPRQERRVGERSTVESP
jgi:hypothetical protein